MKHDKKKYLKKTVMVTASTMLAMNSVLASPLLWNVSAAEETRVTQESKIARANIVKATAKSQMASDPIDKSLDGNASTYTDSDYTDTTFTMPQIYTFELDNTKKLSKVRILPRSDSTNGRVASYEVLVSTDGSAYTSVKTGTADPTSTAWIEIPLDVPIEAKFVQLKLRATEENFNSFHVVTTAEVELYEQVTIAEADKTELQKLYNECKDFKPFYNTETSGITSAFQSALANAEAVINDETATQETVTSAINKLKNRYGLMITSEYTYHYSLANKNGEFTNKYVDFNEYTTDSLRALVDVCFASRNHMNTNFDRPQDTEQLYAWHAQFVEAEKKLVKVDADNTYGQMVGLNPYAASGTQRGVFTVTEKQVTDNEGNKKIRLHVTYENNGLDPITQTDVTGKGKWKSSELKNFTVYMEYERYSGESGRKGVTLEDTNASDGLAFDIDVEPGIYSFELFAPGGTKSATAGYYHTKLIEDETVTISSKINGNAVSGKSLEDMVAKSGLAIKDITSLELTEGVVTQKDLAYLKELSYLENFTMNLSDTLRLEAKDGSYTTALGEGEKQAQVVFAPKRSGSSKGDIVNVRMEGVSEVYENGIKSDSVEELYLPDVVTVGDDAFSTTFPWLETVDLSNAKVIGKRAFSDCRRLESLTLKKVETLQEGSFEYTDALTKLTLPKTLKTIENIRFGIVRNGNKSGTKITLQCTTPPTVANGAFKGVSSVTRASVFIIPHGSLEAYSGNSGDKYMKRSATSWNNLFLREEGSYYIEYCNTKYATNYFSAYVAHGEAVGAARIPMPTEIEEGKVFKEWNTKKDGTGQAITAETVLTEDVSVFPIFEEKVVDTEAPQIENIEWSTRHSTNDPVVVTLTFSEPISKLVEKVDGEATGHEWKKIDDVTYQREYTENAKYKIHYEDLAGNPCKREELLIVDNYFKDPLVKDVYFTGVHVDKGNYVEIELNAKPYDIADPNGEYVFKDGKHLLILDEEALATNDYYDTMCLYGNDNRDSKPDYKYPATWSYIYRDENGKLSVGRIDRVDKPEVILTVGDKEYDLNENPGAFGDPFVLPEAGVLGEPITVSVKAPYIDDYHNNKPVTTVQLTGTGEGKTAGDVATNHQSAQLKLVSQDGTTKSGTYCLTINYNYSPNNIAIYYVKVNYKKAVVNKEQLAFQISLAQKVLANEHWYKHNEAWENMLKAYEKAVEVYNDTNATQTVVDEAKKELATSLMYIRIETDAPVFSGVEDGGIYNHDVTYDVYDQSLDVIIIDGVRYDDPADAPRTITTEGKHVITAMDEDKGLPGLHKETTVTFVIDKTKPVVEVFDEKGNTVGSTYEMTLHVGDEYIEYGAYVKDNLDGEHKLSNPTAIYFIGADGKEVAVDVVDTSKVGEYRLEYQFSDQAGNQETATRIVKIVEADVPIDPEEPSEPNDPNKPIKPVDPVKPQKPENPKDEINTGDVTNMAAILILLLASGAGLVVLKKKSRQ